MALLAKNFITDLLLPSVGGNPPPYEFGFKNSLSGEALVDILRRARTVRPPLGVTPPSPAPRLPLTPPAPPCPPPPPAPPP